MAAHNELGKKGEEMAAAWLLQNGYEILDQNWRCGTLEIDVIAKKGNTLHFIEVKTRYHSEYANPEDSVTRKKFKNIQYASNIYLLRNPGHNWIQYDIIAITMHKQKEPEFFFIGDVYF